MGEEKSSGIISESGRPLKLDDVVDTEKAEKVATDDQGKVNKIFINGEEVEIVNSVTIMEVVVHKLVNGQEVQQLIAHEFMMTDHKPYMVRQLTEAINTVVRAKRRKSIISDVSQALVNKLTRARIKDKFFKRRKRR